MISQISHHLWLRGAGAYLLGDDLDTQVKPLKSQTAEDRASK